MEDLFDSKKSSARNLKEPYCTPKKENGKGSVNCHFTDKITSLLRDLITTQYIVHFNLGSLNYKKIIYIPKPSRLTFKKIIVIKIEWAIKMDIFLKIDVIKPLLCL